MSKKPKPKPLFSVKFDFVDSLDNFIQEAVLLRQVLMQSIDLDLVQEPAKGMLTERLAALANAMDETEEPTRAP